MKKRILLLAPILLAALSGCESNNNKTKPYTEPAKDINSLADFEKMVADNPIKNETTKTPIKYSLNVDLDFKNQEKQYELKDVELIGNGHRLKNITIDETNNSGLFSKVQNCIFRNFTIMNSSIYGSDCGALVGTVDQGVFESIKIADTVIVGDGTGSQVGGIIGNANNASVQGCENNAEISGGTNVGGIVGHAYNSDITHCTNYANISGQYGANIGGVVGTFQDFWRYEAREDLFDSNENYGNVEGTECDYVGGLIGNHNPTLYLRGSQYPKVNISRCINGGSVSGDDYVGGVSGNAQCDLCDVIFTNCINEGTVIGKKYVGGVAGYTFDFSQTTPYTSGDEIKRVQFNGCKSNLNEDENNYISGELYVGGIAGNGAYFRNCTNNIEVKLTESAFSNSTDDYNHQYQHSIGGIVGLGYGNTDLTTFDATTCINNGKISGISNEFAPYSIASSLGGICGFSYGGTFSRCENYGELFATQCIGGILGAMEPKADTRFSNCISQGNLNFYRTGGGIFGNVEASDTANAEIKMSLCTVNIQEAKIYGSNATLDDKYVAGGFIGRATSTSEAESDYKKVILINSESTFNYKTPAGAENMIVEAFVGFNKKLTDDKPLVIINTETTTATATRIGDIE